mmetsp:Transcript_104796/g.291857  ORF Transcript_104796/g.291857 Transcript_104796/m.291857 type:complete len:520 (-) Transcript_104796:319-1878(-)
MCLPEVPKCCGQCCVALLCVACLAAPIAAVSLAVVAGPLGIPVLCAIGIGVPLVSCCICCMPISQSVDPNPFPGGWTWGTLRGASFGTSNYIRKMVSFAQAGMKIAFRQTYGKWFADQTEDDPTVGVKFGGNTRMLYSWAACKDRLESFGERLAAGTADRESELALAVLNNLMWPEAGKFSLGFNAEDHGFVRPFLAAMFDGGQDKAGGWTQESLRKEFALQFGGLSMIDHNLVTRNGLDVVMPSKSKTVVTQMVLKVLHKVSVDLEITDAEAVELAAMQTTQLLPAAFPARVTRTCCMWSCLGQPVRAKEAKWIEKYKEAIQQRFPDYEWTDRALSLMASCFLDAMLQAGGRSVPLAIDLVLGYILSKNRPASLEGVDFTDEVNIRKLMLEAMRYHPPVTVLPTWVQVESEWQHELLCLDRACADPTVFKDPDEFLLDRDNAETASMAWGDFALVNGDPAHPHAHACPGKELSINMVVAFIKEYQAAGPWQVADDDIKFNYYGTTKGFKLTKTPAAAE